MRLTKAVIPTGIRTAVWKLFIGVVDCKPGNDNYMKLKAYHSRFLLRCILKGVEKLVAELFSKEAKRRGLMSEGKFASSKEQSAINAAATIVE